MVECFWTCLLNDCFVSSVLYLLSSVMISLEASICCASYCCALLVWIIHMPFCCLVLSICGLGGLLCTLDLKLAGSQSLPYTESVDALTHQILLMFGVTRRLRLL